MKIIKIAGNTINKTVNSLIEKNKKCAENNRNKLVIKSHKNTIKNYYEKIGKYYYENMRSKENEYLENLCSKIDSSAKIIEQFREKLIMDNDIKNSELKKDTSNTDNNININILTENSDNNFSNQGYDSSVNLEKYNSDIPKNDIYNMDKNTEHNSTSVNLLENLKNNVDENSNKFNISEPDNPNLELNDMQFSLNSNEDLELNTSHDSNNLSDIDEPEKQIEPQQNTNDESQFLDSCDSEAQNISLF